MFWDISSRRYFYQTLAYMWTTFCQKWRLGDPEIHRLRIMFFLPFLWRTSVNNVKKYRVFKKSYEKFSEISSRRYFYQTLPNMWTVFGQKWRLGDPEIHRLRIMCFLAFLWRTSVNNVKNYRVFKKSYEKFSQIDSRRYFYQTLVNMWTVFCQKWRLGDHEIHRRSITCFLAFFGKKMPKWIF